MNQETRVWFAAGLAGSLAGMVACAICGVVLEGTLVSVANVLALIFSAAVWALGWRHLYEGFSASPLRRVDDGRLLTDSQRTMLLVAVYVTAGGLWYAGTRLGPVVRALLAHGESLPVFDVLSVCFGIAIAVAGWAHFFQVLKTDDHRAWGA